MPHWWTYWTIGWFLMKHFHHCTIHETTQMDNIINGTSYWLSLGWFSLKISHLLCGIRIFCRSYFFATPCPQCVFAVSIRVSLTKFPSFDFFVQPFHMFRFQVYSFHLTSSSFDRLCLSCSQYVSQAESNPPWTLKLSIFLQLSTLSPASHTLRGVTIKTEELGKMSWVHFF